MLFFNFKRTSHVYVLIRTYFEYFLFPVIWLSVGIYGREDSDALEPKETNSYVFIILKWRI
jgi:hypothetical protein